MIVTISAGLPSNRSDLEYWSRIIESDVYCVWYDILCEAYDEGDLITWIKKRLTKYDIAMAEFLCVDPSEEKNEAFLDAVEKVGRKDLVDWFNDRQDKVVN